MLCLRETDLKRARRSDKEYVLYIQTYLDGRTSVLPLNDAIGFQCQNYRNHAQFPNRLILVIVINFSAHVDHSFRHLPMIWTGASLNQNIFVCKLNYFFRNETLQDFDLLLTKFQLGSV